MYVNNLSKWTISLEVFRQELSDSNIAKFSKTKSVSITKRSLSRATRSLSRATKSSLFDILRVPNYKFLTLNFKTLICLPFLPPSRAPLFHRCVYVYVVLMSGSLSCLFFQIHTSIPARERER